MCGEQRGKYMILYRMVGSPPRVRGTVSFGFGLDSDSRITPACAGNSIIFCKSTGNIRDHPRVCGEQPPPTQNCLA